ncbi:MAG: hypothetical protein RM022_004570 [Nostoc sp. EfeVER01]|nr:hypothetical protein [Nostoc sp. EfeVER01]MDZ7944435.1 hypothetical protein [Nostoc sp. EfeVER01]
MPTCPERLVPSISTYFDYAQYTVARWSRSRGKPKGCPIPNAQPKI